MNSNKWNEIVNFNDSKVYHLYEWGNLLNEVHGHKLVYLEKDDNIFPLVYMRSILFGNRLISLPFADYGGLCANDESADFLIEEAEDTAKKMGVDFIEIRSPDKKYHDIFQKHGFVRRDDYFTYILELNKNIDELWDSIGKKNRNMIRKAEKSGIEIEELHDRSDVKIFYYLYLKTMKKLGSPPQPLNFFEKIWDYFHEENLIIILSKYEGKYIAGSLYFVHKDTIHHSYNCSLEDFLRFGQNNFMQWYIIKWGCERGFKYLDFGRTRENAGNDLFKRRWGVKQVEMPYFYKFYKQEMQERDEIKYKTFSKIWSLYMPDYLANRIGPLIIKQIG